MKKRENTLPFYSLNYNRGKSLIIKYGGRSVFSPMKNQKFLPSPNTAKPHYQRNKILPIYKRRNIYGKLSFL